jgi:hypothetical protein
MRRLAALSLLLLLGSCSQLTRLSARFIDGQLAFVAADGGAVECVHAFGVTDAETRVAMWEVGRPGDGDCIASLPIRYGQSAGQLVVAKRPLVPGRRYEASGTAAAGNHLYGDFSIAPITGWRAVDVPAPGLVDTANNSH